jgi:hypothetical protein
MGWPAAPNRLIGLSAGLDDAQAYDACPAEGLRKLL